MSKLNKILLLPVLLLTISSVYSIGLDFPYPPDDGASYFDFESCVGYYDYMRFECYYLCEYEETCVAGCDETMRTSIADICAVDYHEFCDYYMCGDCDPEDCPGCTPDDCTALGYIDSDDCPSGRGGSWSSSSTLACDYDRVCMGYCSEPVVSEGFGSGIIRFLKSKVFWIIPWWIVILALIIVLLVAFGTTLLHLL